MAPICTPFARDGEVHHDALRQNMAKYNRTALAGFVVAGTTGEAAFLGREEKRKLFETVRDSADRQILIAGTGVESVRETLGFIR